MGRGFGDEVDLAISIRRRRRCSDSRHHESEVALVTAAEAEALARGCKQTIHFTYDFQTRALYEQIGYERVSRLEDFPSGTNVLWYRKRLAPTAAPTNAI